MTHAEIRQRAHAAARAEIARDLGSLMIGDTVTATELNWTERYLHYFWTAFAFHAAVARGATAQVAAQILSTTEVQNEIAARVAGVVNEVTA